MSTDRLVAFLQARLNEAEDDAPNHRQDCASHSFTRGYDECEYSPWRCDCGVPARALADIAAKRAIIALYAKRYAAVDQDVPNPPEFSPYNTGVVSGLNRALRLLASVYADHEAFDAAWAVDVSASAVREHLD